MEVQESKREEEERTISVAQGGQDSGLELVDIKLVEEGDTTVPIEQPVPEVVADREVAGKHADTLVPPPCRIVVFFNARSGGQKGAKVEKSMTDILGEDNVYDLATCNPKAVLLGLRGTPGILMGNQPNLNLNRCMLPPDDVAVFFI